MSLTSALHIGRSAIVVSQAGMQVTGNNMANATTPGYTRQSANIVPARGQLITAGAWAGRGVELEAITRQVDEAIRDRIRDSYSNEAEAKTSQQLLTQVETLMNELSDDDLSSALSSFFNSWSELANTPNDPAVRSLLVQEGVNLSAKLTRMREDFVQMRTQIDEQLASTVVHANDLLDEIAVINRAIADSEQGRTVASSLRDQRDQMLQELAGFMDISTVEQANGMVDVFVGSLPIVLGDQSRGLELRVETEGATVEATVRVRADGSELPVQTGSIGALLEQREGSVVGVIDAVDDLSGALIWEVNRIHSQGQGGRGYSSVTGSYIVSDSTVPLNDSETDLPFEIMNGSFMIHVTNDATGSRQSFEIQIDLDGVGSDTSLDDLVSQINTQLSGVGVSAAVTVDGRLQLDAPAGYSMTFSDDSSGALAGLGINTYFTGANGTDIAVNQYILDDSEYLAAGMNHMPGSNGTALAIVGLENQGSSLLNGASLRQFWIDEVESVAVKAGAANGRVASTTLVRESLEAQDAAVSGVSLDEESINLMNYQRQYEAAARLIAVVDEMMRTLLSVI
ncbi:MAG: flagellar hook-associated protein FlgK [Phycisphaerales bacterium]